MARPHINVIDCYHGNKIGNDAFPYLKDAGVLAIIHKASQGAQFRDPQYYTRRELARNAGLLWGSYHFLTSAPVEAQIENFTNSILDDGFEPHLIACDYEDYGESSPTLQQAYQFMAAMDRFHPQMQCVLYSGNRIRDTLRASKVGGFSDPAMKDVAGFMQQHRLWLAHYAPQARVPYPWNEPVAKASDENTPLPAPGIFLWQFTQTGRINPLVGNTDGNFFDGDFDQLKARWLA